MSRQSRASFQPTDSVTQNDLRLMTSYKIHPPHPPKTREKKKKKFKSVYLKNPAHRFISFVHKVPGSWAAASRSWNLGNEKCASENVTNVKRWQATGRTSLSRNIWLHVAWMDSRAAGELLSELIKSTRPPPTTTPTPTATIEINRIPELVLTVGPNTDSNVDLGKGQQTHEPT